MLVSYLVVKGNHHILLSNLYRDELKYQKLENNVHDSHEQTTLPILFNTSNNCPNGVVIMHKLVTTFSIDKLGHT